MVMNRASWLRWILFGGVVAGCARLLLTLPPAWSAPLFFGGSAGLVVALIVWRQVRARRVSWAGRLMDALRLSRGVRVTLLLMVGLVVVVYGVRVLNQPDYEVLLRGLRHHVYVFWRLSVGEYDHGLDRHDETLADLHPDELTYGLALAALGSGLVWLALWRSGAPRAWFPPVRAHIAGWNGRARWLALAVTAAGAALLLALAEANSDVLGVDQLAGWSMHRQFGLLVGGVLLVVIGLGGMPRLSLRLSVMDRGDMLVVAAITGLAVFARFWQLELAVHRMVDEIHFVNAVNRFYEVPEQGLLQRFGHVTSFPFLYPYLQSLSVDVMGRSLAAIRAPSAILGALTVPALYLLARALFNRRVGLMAALLLATYPPHLHFSRLGLNNIADPLFGVLAIGLLARGLRHRRRLDFALSGAALGLTQYFYDGGRLLFPVLIALWLLALWPLGRLRGAWRGVLVMVLVALIVAAPVYITVKAEEQRFSERINRVGLKGDYFHELLKADQDELRRAHLWHVALSFLTTIFLPDLSWFYGDRNPYLPDFLAPLALVGVCALLRRWREPGAQVVLLWVIGALAAQSLLYDNVGSPRYVVIFPALVLLVAVGVEGLLDALRPLLSAQAILPRADRMMRGLAALLVMALAVHQVDYYFQPYLAHFNTNIRGGHDVEDALFRSIGYPPGSYVHIVTPDKVFRYNVDTILTFWQLDLEVNVLPPSEFTPEYLDELPRDVAHLFFLPLGYGNLLVEVRGYFAVSPPLASPFDVPPDYMLYLFYAPEFSTVRAPE